MSRPLVSLVPAASTPREHKPLGQGTWFLSLNTSCGNASTGGLWERVSSLALNLISSLLLLQRRSARADLILTG